MEELCGRAFEATGHPLSFQGEGVDRQGIDEAGVPRVVVDPRYFRPTEVDVLLGDPTLARRHLGWRPTVTFTELVERMVRHDLRLAEIERHQLELGNGVPV